MSTMTTPRTSRGAPWLAGDGKGAQPSPRSQLFRSLVLLAVASFASAGLLAAGILLFGDFGERQEKIVETLASLGGFSLVALASSMRIENRRAAWLGAVGIVAAGVSFVFLASTTWAEIDATSWDRAMMGVFILAGAIAFASLLMLLRPRSPLVRWILSATFVFLVVTVAMSEYLVLLAPESMYEGDAGLFGRLQGAAGILTVVGAIVAPILNRIFDPTPA